MERARAGFWLYAFHLWTIFGIAVSNFFLGLSALAALPRWGRLPLAWSRWRGALVPLGLYALFLVIAVAASYEPRNSLWGLRELLNLISLPLALLLVAGEARVRRIVDGLIVAGTCLALGGLAQFLIGYGGLFQRIRGPFSHYMTFAGVLLLIDCLLIAGLACGRKPVARWRWLALVVINLALLASLTRSAWVAFGITLTLLLLMRAPRLIAAYVPAVLLFVLLAPVPLLNRVSSIGDLGDRSNYDRLCMAEAGLRMVSERPLFGLGPGLVEARYPIYRHPTAPRRGVPHLHNSMFQIAAEKGLLALGSYLWLMIGAALLAYRLYRREQAAGGPLVDLYLGAFLALVAFHLAGLFEDNWGDTEVKRLLLFAVAIPYCLRGDGGEPEPASDD